MSSTSNTAQFWSDLFGLDMNRDYLWGKLASYTRDDCLGRLKVRNRLQSMRLKSRRTLRCCNTVASSEPIFLWDSEDCDRLPVCRCKESDRLEYTSSHPFRGPGEKPCWVGSHGGLHWRRPWERFRLNGKFQLVHTQNGLMKNAVVESCQFTGDSDERH